MLSGNINKSKKYILSEFTASKILQQESQKQEDDLFPFFNYERIKQNRRNQSKITKWNYQGNKSIRNENENCFNTSCWSKGNNFAKTKIKQSKIERSNISSIKQRLRYKSHEMQKSFQKNSFSISLLNANMQEINIYLSPQKLKRPKSKVIRNQFINNFSNLFRQKIKNLSNKKVHTQASDMSLQNNKRSWQLQLINNIKIEDKLNYPKSNTFKPSYHNKRKTSNFTNKNYQQRSKQEKISERHNTQVLRLIGQSNIAFRQSIQFIKLKNLLSLQKI